MNAGLPAAQEEVIALAPLTVRRTVRWSECDPAGVVYAGKYPDYMINAMDQFRTHVAKTPLGRGPRRAYDTPGKALSMVFLSPLWPGDVFDMAVFLDGVGGTTVHMTIAATRADNGAPVFAGRLSSIRVDAADRMRAVPVTPEERAQLEDYTARCGPAPEMLRQVAFAH